MSLFDQLSILHEAQLHEDVKQLTSILLSLSDHDPELMSLTAKYQTLVYRADAFFNTNHYKKAEVIYLEAIETKKALNKVKGKPPAVHLPSEVDVKYRLHHCYLHLKQLTEALSVLECITPKKRNAKINMALAKLYQKAGWDRSSVTCYKEVLRECPLSFEAWQALLSFGVKGIQVNCLIMNGFPSNTEWLSYLIKAYSYAANKDYKNAAITFKLLDTKPLLFNNVEVLCNLGEALFLQGSYPQAAATLKKVHKLDPLVLRNMDTLAFLMMKKKKAEELEKFATELISVSELAAEPWIALGYFCLLTRKPTRAVYFAQKAHLLDGRSIEALVLKGSALLELKHHADAIEHFREAMRLNMQRYEAHRGLVDCYLASKRIREAVSCAAQALKAMGGNPRTFSLYASVLVKEPITNNIEKAKTYAEKALKVDPTHLDAVYILCDIYTQQQLYDRGAELTRKQLKHQSTSKLHQMLADFLIHKNDFQEALEHYNTAIRLDSSNDLAKAGRERVEKQTDLNVDSSTYIVEVEMEGSENEADLENSDIESAWSGDDLGGWST